MLVASGQCSDASKDWPGVVERRTGQARGADGKDLEMGSHLLLASPHSFTKTFSIPKMAVRINMFSCALPSLITSGIDMTDDAQSNQNNYLPLPIHPTWGKNHIVRLST